jgi:outer membrane receptor for ferrienterochelin and colicin
MTIGARGDYNTRFGGTFNPRVGFVMRPTDTTTVKALYGTAFLAPSPFQSNAHYGSFYSLDGGKTFASNYWHLPNPDLKPQHERTAEVEVLQSMSHSIQLSGSAFFARFTDLIKSADADQSYAGFYHGWPVDYIDFPVNEGHSTAYGGSLGVDYARVFAADRRLEVHVRAAYVDGREQNEQGSVDLPIGAMSPMQVRVGADLDWGAWRMAPRLSLVGAQRLLATTLVSGSLERRTLEGYATVDVNVRRNLFKGLDMFVTLENALDRRYRTINTRAYTNPEELIGAPQNPRRVTVGLNLRIR